ncbi:hypothetical protein [Pseudomonas fluorescens]|uniref:hypothetical protein n=1 Tax=Pseudomonas fluorescens TaxID=294 RepID=UPI001269F874|nr:hypothetical protein [Pseudomonas fluorescens]
MSIQKFLGTLNSNSVKSVTLMAVDMQIENKICDQFECGADGNCEFKIFLSNDKPEFVIIETPTSCPEISFVNNGVAGRYSIIEVHYLEKSDCFGLTTVIKRKNGWKEFNFIVQFFN